MESSSDKDKRLQKAADQIVRMSRQQKPQLAGTMTLAEYRGLFVGTEAPSHDQIADFVDFLSGAHSWYKHLPASAPGAAFQIYLDPHAGMDRVRTSDGRTSFITRPEGGSGFHYTWMPTSQYRRRFGHLEYATDYGTKFLVSVSLPSRIGVREGVLDNYRDLASIFNPTTQESFLLPEEICVAGRVHLTSAVYDWASVDPHWQEHQSDPEAIMLERERQLAAIRIATCHVVSLTYQ